MNDVIANDIPMETKSKIMNSIFLPTLTYQCQTWTMTKPLECKITTCEMRCLRKAVNKTRRLKRHDPQNQDQRNGRHKEHPSTYPTAEDQNGLDTSQDCQSITQLNVHKAQDFVAVKQKDAPGRPGLTESKRHYLCITSLLPRHSDVQQTNVSFFPRRPKWYKR